MRNRQCVSVDHSDVFFGCFQVEVTFNFLEIRAMNTYPEHQVKTFFLPFVSSQQWRVLLQ